MLLSQPVPESDIRRPSASRRVTLLPLVAATYFMVAGGPYGLEEIVGGAGYRRRHRRPARDAARLERCRRR